MKTILKILVALVTVSVAGVGTEKSLFRQKTDQVILRQEAANSAGAPQRTTPDSLPATVRNYLRRVLPTESVMPTHVVLKQRGEIQTKPEAWTPFTATQHIFATRPGFVWMADAFPVYVREFFLNGKGQTLINLLGLGTIGRDTGPEMNQGAMLRYLGELCWLPAAFLDQRLRWQEQSPGVVEATLSLDGTSVSGVFTFDETTGLIRRFEALRYHKPEGGTYRLERWRVTVGEYQSFAGGRVPTLGTVTWRQPEGDLEAIRLRLVAYDAH